MPVSVEKKTVIIQKSKSNKVKEIEVELTDYGNSQVDNVVISAAAVTFELKGEDRHQVLSITEDETFRSCQKKLRCEPRMVSFIGVYDGHDTDMASEYCSKGMVPHILSELTAQSTQRGSVNNRWSIMGPDRANAPLAFDTSSEDPTKSDMELPYIAAFQKAQERFANKLEPPTFDELVKQPGPMRVAPPPSLNPMQWMAASAEPQRGGTTACTLSVFTELGETLPTVVVANTGDSRLITDDASGSHKFRQLTTEHRPDNPKEKRRLTEAVARGETTLHRSAENRDVRIFPGGLAVSRTIGDVTSSKSVICTPEVVNVPLKIASEEEGTARTQRFVVASDGVWDVVENEAVGKAAARHPLTNLKRRKSGDGSSRSKSPVKRASSSSASPKSSSSSKRAPTTPKEAAMKILQVCLEAGGNRDDVTICVVDVSYR